MSGWNGSTVRKARAYWRPRIVAAQVAGDPIVCPFHVLDPLCPGPIMHGQAWDVDHRDKRIDGGPLGVTNQHPAHEACNRRDGQRVAAQRKAERVTRIRSWI